MEVVRTINIEHHYVPDKSRFGSHAFRNYRGGISVFALDCACDVSEDVCTHVRRFYISTVKREPFAYWRIRKADLEDFFGSDGFQLVPTKSITGDNCHYDIRGLKDKQAGRFFDKYCRPADLFLCIGGEQIQLSAEQVATLPDLIAGHAFD